ncbi:Pentatricopeptide repeat-containing protein C18H10.11c [Fusarium oxysporum f. sp. cubense race 1]|uniref:Pentatricopeptide repeat-containing protein C18H10.11c n=1 Tax=Fusarium oxysporum f. sp. cubense (strain race 1) TaxID=1229664 RepID=N4UP72_FUSC1|nr:Pentatricopeptide repeat-containing protein C18H10.11c [Fusarium oxysporum f. sp. cubense race 1]
MADRLLHGGACLRRALQLAPRQRLEIRPASAFQTRSFQHSQRMFNSTTTPTTEVTTTAQDASSIADAITKDAPKSLDAPADEAIWKKKETLKMERAVNKELQYLNNDPWKVAEYVRRALEAKKFDEAHLLVQKGSKDMQLVVPWNLLLEYLLDQQQVKAAIKLFNEMKKRAQFPNAQTYTTLFRGLAKSKHPKTAVFEAVKHYNALFKDSRLEPNSTHMNAVLSVCNRAGDLDSMFSIVDTLNESTRAPTSYTYTTVLNAIRFNTLDGLENLTPEQKEFNLKNGIQRAKAIWSEVMSKWRQGRLIIDEELVCSMGRMMIISSDTNEKKGVLDLIEQTMNIPNLSKVKEMSAEEARKTNPHTGQVVKKDKNGVFTSPGNNTLSLILKVVLQTKLNSLGIKYWNFILRQYNLEPDRDCWLRLFSILKQAKASGHATEILDIIPASITGPNFYRIAFETCVRDNINPNVIKNADRALDSMMNHLEVPDTHLMRLYLNVSQSTHYHLRARAREGDVAGAKRAYGVQITDALDRLWVPYRKLHDHYFKRVKAVTKEQKKALYNDQREVIALARIMYGSFNKVIQQEIRPVGGRINREIQAFYAKREETEPNLRKTKGRGTAEEDMSAHNEAMNMVNFWDTTQAGKPRSPKQTDQGRLHRDNGPGDGYRRDESSRFESKPPRPAPHSYKISPKNSQSPPGRRIPEQDLRKRKGGTRPVRQPVYGGYPGPKPNWNVTRDDRKF